MHYSTCTWYLGCIKIYVQQCVYQPATFIDEPDGEPDGEPAGEGHVAVIVVCVIVVLLLAGAIIIAIAVVFYVKKRKVKSERVK